MPERDTKAVNSLSRLLDLWIPQRMQFEHIAGLSIGLISGGKLVLQKAYGFADVEKRIKARPETNYRIASISKMFTAVALLQLAEQKKLHLDDSASLYLPWLNARRGNREAKDITIRQLLSHTSGLWRDGRISGFTTDKFPAVQTLQKEFSPDALSFAALEQFKYSNFAFALLGEVIRKASGEKYIQYIKAHILQPLKMQNTAADLESNTSNLATGYGRFIPGKRREKFPQVKTNAYASAAGVISNIQDLAKFLAFLSSEDGTRILGKTSKKEMRRIHIQTGNEGNRFYGLGTNIDQRDGQRFFGHGGGFQGFATNISFNQKDGVGVIVLTNGIEVWSHQIALYIHDVFSGIKEEVHQNRKQTSNMRRHEGYYRNRWGDLVLVQAGNKLIVRGPFDSPEEKMSMLVQIGKNKFRIEGKGNFDEVGDSLGEYAHFTKEKGEDTLWWGASPYRKMGKPLR